MFYPIMILSYLQSQLQYNEQKRLRRSLEGEASLILCGRSDAYQDAIKFVQKIIDTAEVTQP